MTTEKAIVVQGRAGAYVLGALLGRGASANVYRGTAVDGGGVVAIKLLSSYATQDSAGPRFEKEMKILLGLKHPHILAIRDVIHEPTFGIATDLIEGPSLGGWIEERGALRLGRVCLCFERLAHALSFAHARGVIHRDVKPDNVLMRSVDAVDPVLCDFGLAKLSKDDVELTRVGTAVGTVDYMSPEQVLGERDLTAAVDIYGLGCALYQAATGRLPFEGSKGEVIRHHASTMPEPPSTYRENLPYEFDAIVLRMLEKDPGKRPGLDGIQAVLAHIRTTSTVEFDREKLLQKLGIDRDEAAQRNQLTGPTLPIDNEDRFSNRPTQPTSAPNLTEISETDVSPTLPIPRKPLE